MKESTTAQALFCNNLFQYRRFATREVKVGSLGIGGNNPIRIQSMTTTDTMDTEATVAQAIRMIDAGCELVRITAPSVKAAQNLAPIKEALRKQGYDTPLVADIHFTPNAAMVAAGIVEKVRINPGNFADKKRFEEMQYSDESYAAELSRIRERFTPLVLLCKEKGTAMRIGTNHGSLSDRILSRYGDTPRGMVESAMEFLRICRNLDYHEVILSMKASNPIVMVEAYRLLVSEMRMNGMNYPLHLGVTEAGDGEDGRVKSAVGIGALLEDGLGDTVRVSLTEEPEAEMPVARKLVDLVERRRRNSEARKLDWESCYKPYAYERKKSVAVQNFGGDHPPAVIVSLAHREKLQSASLYPLGYQYAPTLDKWNLKDQACEAVFTGDLPIGFNWPGGLINISAQYGRPVLSAQEAMDRGGNDALAFIALSDRELHDHLDHWRTLRQAVFVLQTDDDHPVAALRSALLHWYDHPAPAPVVIRYKRDEPDTEKFRLDASAKMGSLLTDGLGDGLWLENPNIHEGDLMRLAFGILQATRSRISKTEYIACPSCGRTLFDLQETTARIRRATAHLKGVKIGIMGCIVNGPGEMADADYGYVGTGLGKISLYKEKEVVKKNVDEAEAVDALISLIREHGDWREPQ